MPTGIVPKSLKPGFVSYGAIDVGGIWVFRYKPQATICSILAGNLVRVEHDRPIAVSAFREWERGVA